ncbi:oxidoreductase [Nocardioides taihuensis]|uniref:Oxidoreductase n=1 Tax=Nocardioides taihuensis TaxID=1835606 RepID=A0ABW0BPY0_9ACTN
MRVATDVWDLTEMPDLSGRRMVVTGVTPGGIGWFTALELARAGASVVLAGRSASKVDDAESAIRAEVPQADLAPLSVDLADLGSVRLAAARAASYGPVDVLVNNAGVMAPPYARTVDGFELQMATNHFGPFALTGLLLPQLVASDDGRVVTVSSPMHRVARRAPLGDPRQPGSGHYSRWQTYAQTKLANLLFTFELDRRCRQAALPVRALAAHPGFAATHLAANGRYGRAKGGRATILDATIRAVAQPAADGALPTLMAGVADLPGSTYCGPSGFRESRGLPVAVGCTSLATDEVAQRALWELSEQATGIAYP